ncbi:hypothetical protein IMZ48_40500 [Candidatus Bathyarchaeota archaeon]|nr:hypothetical protein [Candidatus Bathyarchaeota archaeon]
MLCFPKYMHVLAEQCSGLRKRQNYAVGEGSGYDGRESLPQDSSHVSRARRAESSGLAKRKVRGWTDTGEITNARPFDFINCYDLTDRYVKRDPLRGDRWFLRARRQAGGA